MQDRTTDGIVLVDKPQGMTSHDVVDVARRAFRLRRIGHAGTLDPFATGLLVLLVGPAARLLPYVEGEPKVYDATIRFGAETDTADSTGTVTRRATLPDWATLPTAIERLTGPLQQIPPAYSAKQVAGVRAYEAARHGRPLDLQPVTVVVHDWIIRRRRDDDLDVTITCGSGTYIRALARDLGLLSGSAAHLGALRRLRSGHFDVANAASVQSLRDGAAPILPPRAAVPSMPLERVSHEDVRRIATGQQVPAVAGADRAALIDEAGHLIAIAERSGDAWQPRVVLRTP